MISSIRLLTLLRGKWLYTHCTVKKGHQVCCSPWRHKESDTTEQLNNTVKTLSEERWMTLRKLRTRIRWQNALTPSLPKKKKKKKNRLNTPKWWKVLFHCVWSKMRYSTASSSNKIEMGHTWITDSLNYRTLVLTGRWRGDPVSLSAYKNVSVTLLSVHIFHERQWAISAFESSLFLLVCSHSASSAFLFPSFPVLTHAQTNQSLTPCLQDFH